jgi:hypothetical protein
MAERDPGTQGAGHTPLAGPQLDRRPRMRVVGAQPAWPLDLSQIGVRVKAGIGLGLGLGRRDWTLISTKGCQKRTAGNRDDPPGYTSCAAVSEEPNAALLARNPALVRRVSLGLLGLRLPIAHDPAPLAALVDHSHVLLTSKDNEKKRGPNPVLRYRSHVDRDQHDGLSTSPNGRAPWPGGAQRRRIVSDGPSVCSHHR